MNEVKQYAERDLMEMDRAGNHYCRHVDHMTREKLHSKSDIAAELGWRDMQIANLKEQLTATTNSLTNAQEALKSVGIEADTVQAGVMELKAQRDALAAENGAMRELIGATGFKSETPATDAYIRELRNEAGARAVELFSQTLGSPYSFRDEKCYEDGFTRAIQVVRDIQAPRFAAQLRAGNAGKDGSHD